MLAMAVPPERYEVQTPFYSFRMLRNFGPSDDYLGDLRRAPAPINLLGGEKDEIFVSEEYAPLLLPVRPDLSLTILPDLGHMDMTVRPTALASLAALF